MGKTVDSRRNFLKKISAAAIFVSLPNLLQSCRDKAIKLIIKVSGTNHILGHRIWLKDFPKASRTVSVPYLICGGGITGLSAARQFRKNGIDDFLIVELEKDAGGNSRNGVNKFSKFPLGAHYLPLPNLHDKELIAFLEESQIIIGKENGIPIFDETQMTFAPQERLFIRNTWQDGLVPKFGISSEAEKQIAVFFEMMEFFRDEKGNDAKYVFDIPMKNGSADKKYSFLDQMTMSQWLNNQNLSDENLKKYLDYCCRDDFGLGIEFVSAWAGIHYFAARKHQITNGKSDNVLTWPEGNARLTDHLKKYSETKTLRNHLVFDVKIEADKVITEVFDDKLKETLRIISDKVIFATPQYVNAHLFPAKKKTVKKFHYTPWLLATLTLTDLWENQSVPLCWDNVILDGVGLGYIYNQHQNLRQIEEKKVITYYYSFSEADLRSARKSLNSKSENYWKDLIINDLKRAHPEIESVVESIQIHRIGHGMISPVPDFIFSAEKKSAGENIDGKIFFAHSDLSGISIFEEAFHQGIDVVNKILNETTLD